MTVYFSSFSEFLNMGGHGPYVWSCYVITMIVLFLLILFTKSERKNVIEKLTHQSIRQERLTNRQRQQLK
ncbi:MAG: heme exporter protein CcmD [Moraxella sp.]|jgi:heme exporter protein ccmD|nr:MAG: heme exporter protein CcmD [Moraxella sp.]